MPPAELHPVELPGRRALAIVCSFDYFDTSLGPYRELALGIVVSTHRRLGLLNAFDLLSTSPLTGAWLLALPVTSDLACRGGIAAFGYPKSLCEISVERSSHHCRVFVKDAGYEVLRLFLPLGWGPKATVRRLVTYSQIDGQIIRTRIETQWRVTLSYGRAARLEISNQQHPLAVAAGQLALPNSPLFVLHGGQFRAILKPGERI